MPYKIKPLYIDLSSLNGEHLKERRFTLSHPDLMRWQKRYNTIDISLYRGKEKVTLYRHEASDNYNQKREAIINKVSNHIDHIVLKAIPSYKPIGETMYTKGDTISHNKHSLLMNIRRLCDAYTQGKRGDRETSFYHINSFYLAIMREIYGQETVYHNHKDIACSDHYIPERDRFYGKRKKKLNTT